MKNLVFSLCIAFLWTTNSFAQQTINWTPQQLMEPGQLSKVLENSTAPVIISVGPGAVIPHSVNIGSVREEAGIQKLRKELKNIPRETAIVIYCGCCPFEHCPNVRPAIEVLKAMNFTNYKLLNLPHNIKTDWIDKEYPVTSQ
ncbi:MAG: rhodanese-like protein [Chitinophagaceae bacterium]|nr:rhodanese-like protein [Chitinophagaceae bacterium]